MVGVLGAGGELCSGASESRGGDVAGAGAGLPDRGGRAMAALRVQRSQGSSPPPSSSQGSQTCSELTVCSLMRLSG